VSNALLKRKFDFQARILLQGFLFSQPGYRDGNENYEVRDEGSELDGFLERFNRSTGSVEMFSHSVKENLYREAERPR
jgi:hypothetical protein